MYFIMNFVRSKQNDFSNQSPQACNQFLLCVILSLNDTSNFAPFFIRNLWMTESFFNITFYGILYSVKVNSEIHELNPL